MMPYLITASSREKLDSYIEKNFFSTQYKQSEKIILKPEKDEISILQIRKLHKDLLTYAKFGRIVVISHFEIASGEVQNAMLKLLEEKNEQNQFILTALSIERVLPTILSRVHIVTVDKPDMNIPHSFKDLFDHYFKKKSSARLHFLKELEFNPKTKDNALSLINYLIFYFRSAIFENDNKKEGYVMIIKKAFDTKSEIVNLKINHQFAIDNLLIFILKTISM